MKEYVKYSVSDKDLAELGFLSSQHIVEHFQSIALKGLKPSSDKVHIIYHPVAEFGFGINVFYFPIETG